jgi:hypothetical protein
MFVPFPIFTKLILPTSMNIPPVLLPWSIDLGPTVIVKTIEFALGIDSPSLGLLSRIIWILNSRKLHLVHTSTTPN